MTYSRLGLCVALMIALAVVAVVFGAELGRAGVFLAWSVLALAIVVFVGAGRLEP